MAMPMLCWLAGALILGRVASRSSRDTWALDGSCVGRKCLAERWEA